MSTITRTVKNIWKVGVRDAWRQINVRRAPNPPTHEPGPFRRD
ncbi:hypothetical protein ANO14919_089590 [Xylariales sp. No.14919]|nr:hypothetical protein ANO14919_089590 [Xylariales sp. No.14919]